MNVFDKIGISEKEALNKMNDLINMASQCCSMDTSLQYITPPNFVKVKFISQLSTIAYAHTITNMERNIGVDSATIMNRWLVNAYCEMMLHADIRRELNALFGGCATIPSSLVFWKMDSKMIRRMVICIVNAMPYLADDDYVEKRLEGLYDSMPSIETTVDNSGNTMTYKETNPSALVNVFNNKIISKGPCSETHDGGSGSGTHDQSVQDVDQGQDEVKTTDIHAKLGISDLEASMRMYQLIQAWRNCITAVEQEPWAFLADLSSVAYVCAYNLSQATGADIFTCHYTWLARVYRALEEMTPIRDKLNTFHEAARLTFTKNDAMQIVDKILVVSNHVPFRVDVNSEVKLPEGKS